MITATVVPLEDCYEIRINNGNGLIEIFIVDRLVIDKALLEEQSGRVGHA